MGFEINSRGTDFGVINGNLQMATPNSDCRLGLKKKSYVTIFYESAKY
jgi:hypothetical protein